MVKYRRWDAWIGVGNLLNLIRQPQHHFSQQLRVGFKHISSMSLVARITAGSRTQTLGIQKYDDVYQY